MSKIKLEFKTYDIFELVDPKLVKKIQKIYTKYQHYVPEKGEKPIITLIGDEYEELMNEYGHKCKGQGTNRVVFYYKGKYKDVCLKLACDKHGTEANRREFVNSKTELSKYLTYVYAIDAMGTVIVEEMVTPFLYLNEDGKDKWGNDYREYEDDIRSMLDKLKKKLLLVDCKISNFCNFGLRKDGSVCLLDHGDTTPLPDYQTGETVNEEEEAFVTLTCKAQVDETDPKSKLCGGKLKYSPNYDYLYCTVCHKAYHVNDAYRMPFKWRQEGYHIDKREGHIVVDPDGSARFVDNDSDEETVEAYIPECVAQEKVIDNNICIQIKDYWVPEKYLSGIYSIYKIKLISGKINPSDFLNKFGIINTDIYKVSYEKESTTMQETKQSKEFKLIADKFNNAAVKNFKGQNPSVVKYDEIGLSTGQANAFKCYVIETESRYHHIQFDNNKRIFNIFFTFNYINNTIRPAIKANENSNKKQEIPKMNNSMSAFATFRKQINAGHTQEVNENPVEATINYVVHGMVCAKSADYYLPVKFYKPGLGHDETKEILKSEGYSPKEFKIENNPSAQALSKQAVEDLNVKVEEPDDDDDDFEDLKPDSHKTELDDIEDSIYGEDVIIRPESTLYSKNEDNEDEDDEIEEEIVVPQEAIRPKEGNDKLKMFNQLVEDASLYRNKMNGDITSYIEEHFPEIDNLGSVTTDRYGFPGIPMISDIDQVIQLVINDSEKYIATLDNGSIRIESNDFIRKENTIDAAKKVLNLDNPSKEVSDYTMLTLEYLKPTDFDPESTDYNAETYANVEAIISSLIAIKYVYDPDENDVTSYNLSNSIVDNLFLRFAEEIIDADEKSDNITDFRYQACIRIARILKDFCSNENEGFSPEIVRYLCSTLEDENPEVISSINEAYSTSITANSAFANMDGRKPILTEDVHIHRIKPIKAVEQEAPKGPIFVNSEIQDRINSAPDKTEAIKAEVAELRKKMTAMCVDLDTLMSLL